MTLAIFSVTNISNCWNENCSDCQNVLSDDVLNIKPMLPLCIARGNYCIILLVCAWNCICKISLTLYAEVIYFKCLHLCAGVSKSNESSYLVDMSI